MGTFFFGKKDKKFIEAFKTEEAYNIDRKLWKILKTIKLSSNRKSSGSNVNEVQKLIHAGADAVLGSGIIDTFKDQSIFVVAPNCMLKKSYSATIKDNAGNPIVAEEIDVRFKNIFNVLSYNEVVSSRTRTKRSSVIGQAVVGGALAGGVGAVVGAVNAASNNAAGGKTVTSNTCITRHYLTHATGSLIDTIYVSTTVFDKIGTPAKEIVKSANETFWTLGIAQLPIEQAYLQDPLGKTDEANYKKLKDYIGKLLEFHKSNTKFSGVYLWPAILAKNGLL